MAEGGLQRIPADGNDVRLVFKDNADKTEKLCPSMGRLMNCLLGEDIHTCLCP